MVGNLQESQLGNQSEERDSLVSLYTRENKTVAEIVREERREKRREEIIKKWLSAPLKDRKPYTLDDLCVYLKINAEEIEVYKKKIEGKWEFEKLSKNEKYMAKLEELAMSGRNPRYMELLLKIKGVYKEKSEVKVDFSISPDEFVRRNLRAETELSLEGYRVEKVPAESTLLSKKLRLGAGQDSTGDSDVETVAASGSDSGAISKLDRPAKP